MNQKLLTVGVDEAGRGALAGPVVAAACIIEDQKKIPILLADSKKMTAEEREKSSDWLTKNCIHGIGFVDAKEIDKIGILAATEIAMQKAVKQVEKIHQHIYLLIDGRDAFWFNHPHSSIVKGDETEACISATSILAKVARDAYMTQLAIQFPLYAFHEHKGYGTENHFLAIQKHGLTPQHRRTFLRNV